MPVVALCKCYVMTLSHSVITGKRRNRNAFQPAYSSRVTGRFQCEIVRHFLQTVMFISRFITCCLI